MKFHVFMLPGGSPSSQRLPGDSAIRQSGNLGLLIAGFPLGVLNLLIAIP